MGMGQVEPHTACRNCGTTLAGPFCHACGQAAHIHRSLLHLGEEVLHGILHFDAKGWRTLPLLIARPGLLTRRYIDGQRTRYVSPLALFLFTMFLMFFVLSLTGVSVTPAGLDEARRAEARAELADAIGEAKADVAQREAELAAVRSRRGNAAEAEQALAAAHKAQQIVEAALATFDASVRAKSAADQAASGADPALATLGDGLSRVNTGSAALDEAIRERLKNPELALYKMKNTAYKFAFMLIPISLPFLWLMFAWRRGIAMYDHAVFSLYSLSFMALLFTTVDLLSMTALNAWLPLVMFGVPPLHMFVQLRETHGLRTFSALWRTVALLGVAGTVFVLFVLFIAVVSAS
jgi:hypothetical protein